MVVSTAILLIVGGICAAAPLFKRVSKGLEKGLVILGLAVGVAIIIVAIDLALGLGILSGIFGIGLTPASSSNPYLKYYLVVMAVLGILLFSRPLRNVRWASLIALGIGILAAAYLQSAGLQPCRDQGLQHGCLGCSFHSYHPNRLHTP